MPAGTPPPAKGRGATYNPGNRYRREDREPFDDGWSAPTVVQGEAKDPLLPLEEPLEDDAPPPLKTTVAIQLARTIVARFGDGKGTNPEELVAAAHAGCFTMALSFMLNGAGFTADAIDTEANLTMDQVNAAWTVTGVHLTTRARVPNIDAAKFAELASNAKANCPISRLLNATITLDAALVS